LGHSMVRPAYDLSFRLQGIPIFVPYANGGELADLRGFRPLPKFASIQWDLFLEINGSDPQKSRRLDTLLSPGLRTLPGLDPASLAFRNLLRGYRMDLPAGQTVAKAMGIRPLDKGNDPLWFYILREAAEREKGLKLGPVGARIVAEVFVGLLAGDSFSYLSIEPNWEPEFDREGRNFELRDIIRFTGIPLSEDDLNQELF
ncbi:MAG TPA: peroxidase, partial [Anaerolineae bacterium]